MKISFSQQRGAALITVLLLLLIMTLLGLASLRSGIFEERMSGNLRDRGVGFQAAEGALRQAELVIPTAARPFTGAGGLYQMPVATNTDRWNDSTTNWAQAEDLGGLSTLVRAGYIVEEMGTAPSWPGCERFRPRDPSCITARFRITSRSQAPGRAQVILQSNYALPTP